MCAGCVVLGGGAVRAVDLRFEFPFVTQSGPRLSDNPVRYHNAQISAQLLLFGGECVESARISRKA